MSHKVNWGVLSTANIGWAKVIPAMQKAAHVNIVAVGSRDLSKAEAMAKDLGIARAYGSYEALLADPEIDAVYNPLPNHLHVPLTLAALEAGKHVLCEKPMALTAMEAGLLREATQHSGKLVSEAFMVRHHPQWQRARALVNSGVIGEVRAIQTFFSYFNTDPANVRNQADIGGGGLYDIGCYAITTARYIFGAEPERVIAMTENDPNFGTDRLTSGLADFGAGRHLTFTVSTQLVPYQRVQICGTKGRIEVQIPFNAPANGETRIFIDSGADLAGGGITSETLPACDQYTVQGEAFSRAVLGQVPLEYGLEDAILNMRIIDAFFRSTHSNHWEKP
jgi:predicted dehydrogenase